MTSSGPGEFNIIPADLLDFDTVKIGDGCNDDTVLIQGLIDQALESDGEWDCNTPAAAPVTRILFPPRRTSVNLGAPPKEYSGVMRYRITNTIRVPANKRIVFSGSGPHGATIVLDPVPCGERTGNDQLADFASPDNPLPAFLIEAELNGATGRTRGAVVFERLTIAGGGIAAEAGATRPVVIRDCAFRCWDGWAVDWSRAGETPSGQAGLRTVRCTFSEGRKGVILGPGSRAATIEHCMFVRNRGPDLSIAGSGVHVISCSFEERQGWRPGPDDPDTLPPPFVEISSGAGPDIRFDGLRCGREEYPPPTLVRVRDSPEANRANSTDRARYATKRPRSFVEPVQDVRFSGCHFRGKSSLESAVWAAENSAVRVLELNAPTIGLQFVACSVWDYKVVIDEVWARQARDAATKRWAGGADIITAACASNLGRDNLVADVVFGVRGARLFSDEGRGFEIRPPTLQQAWTTRTRPPSVASGNAISESENLTGGAWNTDRCNVLPADGPDCYRAGPAFRVVPTGSSASLSQRITDAGIARLGGGAAIFSVWMRSDSESELPSAWVALSVSSRSVSLGGGCMTMLPLGREWRRHTALVESLPRELAGDGPGLQISIWLGKSDEPNSSAAAIRVAYPQLEAGVEPTAYEPTSAILRGPLPPQSLHVGGRRIIRGKGPPAPGPAQWYKRGDLIITDEPDVGAPIGWICTESGTPGFWSEFGKVM